MLLLLMLIAAAIAYFIQMIIFEKNYDKGIASKVEFEVPYVEQGGFGSIKEVIENKKWLPLPVVHMSFRTGKGIQFGTLENISVSDTVTRRDVFSLLWHQRITRTFNFRGEQRGHYYIKSADVNVYNLLMTDKYYLQFPQNTELYVYPKSLDTERLNLLMERIFGFLQSTQRFYDDPLSFAGIREYAPGDEMKRINWKASARERELMVNVFDSVMAQKVMIFLDVSDKGIWKQQELAEEGICIVASICKRLLNAGAKVALYSNGYLGNTGKTLEISYETDNQKIHTINRTLCDLKLSIETETPAEMFSRAMEREENVGSIFLLVSKNVEEGYGKEMKQCVTSKVTGRGNVSCMHIIPCHRSLTGDKMELENVEGVQQILWEVEA